jgi:hypothetical protein
MMKRPQRSNENIGYGAPTPERAAIAGSALDRFPIYESNNRMIIGQGHLIATVVQKMFASRQITAGEQKAAELYYRDYDIGSRSPGLTMKYGERMERGGTPLAQQANTQGKTPTELRTECQARFKAAGSHIGDKAMLFWFNAIVCEIPINGSVKPPTLEDAGRAWMGYECKKRAQASGATLIKAVLVRLKSFYRIKED